MIRIVSLPVSSTISAPSLSNSVLIASAPDTGVIDLQGNINLSFSLIMLSWLSQLPFVLRRWLHADEDQCLEALFCH
ncbi:hypothetical protein PsorP6_008249 [Peronosclerospora sorghi]|uniref:Uncharacterized protein n=1 Tax=Peronosclerospora sorghi TaxID=230839 RepID=A0ACC0WCN4_9STRA|nr:hypothetical protein PsorP6_008249 [Peronosclerospora sorghi]